MMDTHEYRPLSELPDDANPAIGGKFSFGTDVFEGSGDWVIVENSTFPTKVYRLPSPVSKILHHLMKARFDMGRDDAQEQMRRALGLG
jgi:hypothetical protein